MCLQRFPKPLDFVDPWMINGLKQQFELRVVGQPALCDVALVNDIIVDDEHDATGAPISALYFVQQVDEQQ